MRPRPPQPGGSGAAAVRSLKVVDRLEGYFRLGDTHANEDPLWVSGDSSVTNLQEQMKGCPTRCGGAPGGAVAELAAGGSRGGRARVPAAPGPPL